MKAFKPLKLEDLNLSPGELKELVEGAQKFTPVLPDPEDDELFVPVDAGVNPETL
jgi:hypothetical protein